MRKTDESTTIFGIEKPFKLNKHRRRQLQKQERNRKGQRQLRQVQVHARKNALMHDLARTGTGRAGVVAPGAYLAGAGAGQGMTTAMASPSRSLL
jgi:hypothetical protein